MYACLLVCLYVCLLPACTRAHATQRSRRRIGSRQHAAHSEPRTPHTQNTHRGKHRTTLQTARNTACSTQLTTHSPQHITQHLTLSTVHTYSACVCVCPLLRTLGHVVRCLLWRVLCVCGVGGLLGVAVCCVCVVCWVVACCVHACRLTADRHTSRQADKHTSKPAHKQINNKCQHTHTENQAGRQFGSHAGRQADP